MTDTDLNSLRNLSKTTRYANVTITKRELVMLVNEVDRLRGKVVTAVPDAFVEPQFPEALRDWLWTGER